MGRFVYRVVILDVHPGLSFVSLWLCSMSKLIIDRYRRIYQACERIVIDGRGNE
jgi:hypothetical protein